MGTPIGFVLGVFAVADQAEDNSKKDVVVEPDAAESTEASTRLSQAGNDTYKPPTATTTDNPTQSPDVQRILDKFSIIGKDAGKDTRWGGFIIGGGEEISGSGAFADTLADRRGNKQPRDANGRPISNGEINTAFRALVDGALNRTPPLEMSAIRDNLKQQLEGTGYDVKFDAETQKLTLVDTRNLDNKGNPREVSRYDVKESPEDTGERMANRTLDPTMTVGQQEAFVKQGLTKMLADMPEADRERFLAEYNRKMEDAGSNQRLDFKEGKASLDPPTDTTLPKGLRLENVGKFNELRNLLSPSEQEIADGKPTAKDVLDQLKATTADLDPRQARLFNANISRELQQKFGNEISISADRNGQNQKLEVELSKQPPVKVEVPEGMSVTDAKQWADSAADLQKVSATPPETYQERLTQFMDTEQGKKLLELFGQQPDSVKRQFIEGLNQVIPEGAKGDFKFGLSQDRKGMDLIRPSDIFKVRLSDTKLDTFLPPEQNAERDAVWSRKPEGVSEQNKKAYVDAVTDLKSSDLTVRGNALRSLRDTMRTLPADQQEAFRKGINDELRNADVGFRITNTDGRVEARQTIVVNDRDVTVPRHLEGDPAKVDAFKLITQGILDGKDPTELTKSITELANTVNWAGKEQLFNSLNGLLSEKHPNLRFSENGLQVKGEGTDIQGQPLWRSVPEGMSLSDASQLGKTIPAGLDGNATRKFQDLVNTLGQNPDAIFNQQSLDQIKNDLNRLDPEQAKIYREQLNAKLGENFQINDSGQLVAKIPGKGDVPVPAGLTGPQAETFRGLVERALTPGSTPASVANDLMSALKPPMTASQQKSFLDGFNEQFKKTHGDQYFTPNGSDLNLNQSQLLPSWASSPVLDTFKSDAGKAAFDSLLRSADFENPGANPKVEAIRDSFTKLRDNPTDAQAMKDLLTQLKDSNFSPEQINALQRAFQADKPDNPPLRIGKEGVIQVGDTTLIRASSGAFMSVTGNMSLDAAQNLKYAAEQVDPQNPMSAFTAKNISEILKSVTDPTVRNSILESFNSFLTASGSKDQIAAHPGGDGIDIARKENGIETNRWVKGTGVEATAAEVATNAMDRLAQNPTDGKALVEALERDRQALTQEVERMLGSGEPPYSPEIESKIQALYQNGNESTKKLIERSLAVVGDFGLASKLGMPENALKVVEFSRDIKANGLDSVGTKLSEFLSHLTPQARNEIMADLRDAVVKSSGQGHELAFNDKNELVLKKGNTVVDGYPNGALGEVLDKMRHAGIADPYGKFNPAKIIDAFNQINANDPAGLKAFLEQLSVAKLDATTQAKLVAGLNEHFHTNVSMNEQGVLTDGTNSFRLAEVNGKAMAIPASLSPEIVSKLGNKAALKDYLTGLAQNGDISQLKTLMQAGNGEFNDVVAQVLQDSGRTDTAALAREFGLSSDVIAAADARDKQLTFQNELQALLPNTSPDVVAQIAQQFDKFKAAVQAGNGPTALAEFAAAAKGNLSAALIDKLNTQLSGFQLAYGTGTLALAKIGGDSLNPYIASVDTSDATAIPVGFMAAHAAEGPKPDAYKAGEVYRVGQLATEANPPILEMPKTPALPDRVMSQLYGLAIETRLELQVALRGKTDPAEQARIVQEILVKKGLDVMGHATTSENGMTIEQRQAFVEAMNKFLLSAASVDGFAPALKDFRFKLSGDATNASLSLEGDGKSIPLTTAESRDRLYEQRLGDALGLDVTKHAELKTSLRALREATTPEARETAYKALLAKMTSLNLTADQMKKMVDTLQDPKFKFIEGTGTISYDGPPNLNLKHFKTWGENFYAPGDMTNKQYLQFSGLMTGFAGDGNIGNFRVNLGSFRQLLASLRPDQREAVVKEAQRALNKWKPEVKLAIDGGNLIVDGITSERVWSITNDAANDLRPTVEKFEVGGKQYDLPPNLTDAQKDQLKGVITELGKPPAGTITPAVREQLAALLKDVPLGTARTEMLRTINAASAELQKTTFTLEGNKLSIITDGKPVTPPIEIPAPTGGPADLATAMKELQALINCNVNPDTGLMRKAISDVARLFAKEKGSNFDPAELARMLNSAGMNNFKFTLDTTSKPGQTEIVVTDKAGKEINRINTRDIVSDATVAAGPVGPAASSERTDIPDLSQVPEAQRPLVAAIFKANDVQSMLKAISEARKANLTQFKIGNDVYRIDVKGLGSNTSLVHMTINGKIAVKAVDRNGVYHPQSDGKFFGSSYLKSNPDSPIATRARDLKLSTPQEVSTAIQAGALTPGRTTDGPLSAQQVQDRLKELGVTIPDTVKAQTAFKQIQDLQNAIRTSNPADIRKALDVLKGNTDLGPQFDGLVAKINANPANALKIEGGAIKLQIGEQKYDIPPTWDANTIRNLVRLSATDAKVAANLYRYINDAQSAVADKGAIMRNLLNSGLDNKQQAALIMEAFKHEKGRNPNYTIQKFVEDLKVIPNAGKPEEPIFEFKGGAFVVSDKSGTVRASIPETDIKAAVASQQLRNMFDATLPGTDPKKADFNPELLPKASKIAEVLRGLTPAERAKAIADLKTDLQTKGIRLDIAQPTTTTPMVEITYDLSGKQIKDSSKIAADAPIAPPEQIADRLGAALNRILTDTANPPTKAKVKELMKTWIDSFNAPGVDRAALVALIQQRIGNNGKLEIAGTGADTKLKFSRTGMDGTAEVALGAPREVAAATGPRTDVPALTDITGVPTDKAPLVQAIYAANDINAMLAAIKAAKAAGITQFKIGNDVIGLQVIGVGKGTSLIHMTVNGKIGVKAVDRNGTFTPQMDGKFFGSNHGNPLLTARSEQWKLRTPQEVTTTLRAGTVRPGDTTVGANVPVVAPLTDQQIKDGLATVGVNNISDTAKARAAFTQIQDLQNALRTANPTEARRLLTALKANTDIGNQFPTVVGKINEKTGTNGALKIDGDTIKMQIGDTKYIIPDNWDANTVRNLSRLASTDAVAAVRIHNYITESQKPGADKAAVLKTLLTADGANSELAAKILLEVFKRESALNPSLTLEQFRNNFQKAAPEGWNLRYEGNALVLKDNKNIARVTIPESGAKIAVASQSLQNLIDVTAPGLDPKKPNFNSALVPKAEKIAEILKGLTAEERTQAMKDITAALAEKNIRVALTGTATSPMVEVSFDTSRGRYLDAKRIGDTAPANSEQTAIAMGTKLKEILGNPATTDAQLSDYLKTITGQLNASGVDRAAFLRQMQAQIDAGTPPKIKLDIAGTGADTKLVLKRESKADVSAPLAPRDVAATTTGDTRPFAEQLKSLSDYLKLPNPPTKEVLDRMLKSLALAHARSTNPPSFDNAAFIAATKLDGTGYNLVNDTSKTPPELVLKKGDTVVSSPIKSADVLAAATATGDKATAPIEQLAAQRGIDLAKIPKEGTPERALFEALLRGKSGKELTLLIKDLYAKGLKTLTLPDANGKDRKINLQVSGHFVHMYAADDSGRMRIAIRGTTDGRPQRGGYFGTRWTESMLGKSIIGTNKDATTPTPEVANPEVPVVGSTVKPPEYRTNPEAMASLEQLVGNPAEKAKPDYDARVAQLFSEAVRHEIATKGKEKAAEIAANLQERFGKKGFQIKFDQTANTFSMRKDYDWNVFSEVDLANVPDKGQPETTAQRAARYLEPFGAMTRDQQKAHLAKIATEISTLGLTQGTQMVEALQTQLKKQSSADSRLTGLNLTLRNNNEMVLERSKVQARVGKVIEYTDSTPVKFATPVAAGDVNSFSTRMQELSATNDGKTPNAAVEEFAKFIQTVPQNANRARIINEALKQALLTHAMLNPTADATSMRTAFNPALQQANRAFSLEATSDGSLNIKGLTNPPESIKATDIAKAKADYAIAQQLRPFGNELAVLAASGGKDFSANFALFAKANQNNPELVKAGLKLALKEQMRLVPDQDITKTLELYNQRMKNSGLDISVGYEGVTGTVSLQRKQGDTTQSLGSITARELMSDAKFNEFLTGRPIHYALAMLNKSDAQITEAVTNLTNFFNANKMTADQINKFLQTLNNNLGAIEIKRENNRLTFRRKAAA